MNSGMERFNNDKWTNRTWSNQGIRQYVDVVDVREEKGLWMQHVCIFPGIDKWWTNIWLGHYCLVKIKLQVRFTTFHHYLKKEHVW